MSIATEISRIQQAKADIKSSIEAKGVTVPSAALIDDYSDYVDAIQTGGGGGNQDLIDLIERNITTFSIPSGTTIIANYAFYDYNKLTSVTIPNSVTSIGDGAFSSCHFSSITIPNGVTSIGDSAFAFTRLSSVNIPNGSIGPRSFSYINSLTSVTIGSGVTAIGENAFQSDSYLSSVNISDLVSWCNIDFGYEGNPLIYASHLYLNGTEINDLVIPNSVTTIKYMAFYKYKGLTSVTIPNSVTTINTAAFSGCSNMTSVTIGSGVTLFQNNIFFNCNSLNSITINTTTPPKIGSYVFNNTNNCPIYVPAESVDAYKTANNWSTYASRIHAIPSE